ncbi:MULTISPECIES: hypothetical protein [unclassified Roseateles]|nr:hypothetical protein [Pelomonas sp. Root1237]
MALIRLACSFVMGLLVCRMTLRRRIPFAFAALSFDASVTLPAAAAESRS